jgi:hypothetical protein
MTEKKSSFIYCFYHIRQGKHLNYHHVLIPVECVSDENLLQRLEGDGYVYYLMSIVPILLTESEQKSPINRPLIMDGESLWKRMKKNRSLK